MPFQFTLLKKSQTVTRLDVLPFIFIYGVVFYYYMDFEQDDEDQVFWRLGILGILFLHCITHLLSHWSARMKAVIQYSQSGQFTQANLNTSSSVLVKYEKQQRTTYYEIVDLKKGKDIKTNEEYFYLFSMQKKFIFNADKKQFLRLKPSVSLEVKSILEDKYVHHDKDYFEKNSLEIPLKQFKDILREQLMEPFSFFQLFSVSLWLMDDNRFTSLLTIFLLFMTACTVVIQRMKTMMMLRQMRLQPQYIQTYRDNRWQKISSYDLVPGDIVILNTASHNKFVEGTQFETDEQYLRREIPFSEKLPPKFFKGESNTIESFRAVPCDMLLISGNIVVNESMLTGESIPQIKDSIDKKDSDEILDLKGRNKNSLIFCGTEIIQLFPTDKHPPCIKHPPSHKVCLAYVLKTGFDTAQGKLIRTVLYNNENAKIKQKDAFAIIFILLCFAIYSSFYVLVNGIGDETRSKNKLFLRCILIITTVVPQELPMILTIAVNQSLLYLQRKKIYCTEPFRIPFGGQITVCAFDKTGTLTSDTLIFKGIIDDISKEQSYQVLKKRSECSIQTQYVLAGCHSLMEVDNKLTGDPIEILYFEGSDWTYASYEKISRNVKTKEELHIVGSYPFKSDLKRMSTIVKQTAPGTPIEYRIFCKGAPEIIEMFLQQVPDNYSESYQYYTRQGLRVLALAQRILTQQDINSGKPISELDRTKVERNFVFSGFFICDSPLKRDTVAIINSLKEAEYNIIMITGDNLLTGAAVGCNLNLGPVANNKSYLSLELDAAHDNEFYWIDDLGLKTPYSFKELPSLSKQRLLCITGTVITHFEKNLGIQSFQQIVNYFRVFARTSPAQKELVVSLLCKNGHPTLMCGDGTNDVGALQKSQVGIALVGQQELTDEQLKLEKEKKQKLKQEMKQNPMKAMQMQQQQQAQGLNPFGPSDQDIKFGDACIAAPFTSKHYSSIRCVNILLRQGVCTLVTTLTTYKILTLSSLTNAYQLTALHMQALKFSETQYTIMGISAAFFHFQFSNSKPLKKLSKIKPKTTIFEPFFIISVVFQCFMHLYCIQESIEIGQKYSSPEDLVVKHDQEFKPTMINSVGFLTTLLSQTVIFLFNHDGEPHMEGFKSKPQFLKALLIFTVGVFVLTFNLLPDINYSVDIVLEGIPEKASQELGWLYFQVVGGCYLMNRILQYLQFKEFHGWI